MADLQPSASASLAGHVPARLGICNSCLAILQETLLTVHEEHYVGGFQQVH